jgi:Protein of unknown function (DUF2630)
MRCAPPDRVKPDILNRNNRGEGKIVEDEAVFHRINELAGEEHEIWRKESRGEATEADRERLGRIQVTLDQCWDLLHQRQARRAAGLDPDEAKVRDEKIVEGYIG